MPDEEEVRRKSTSHSVVDAEYEKQIDAELQKALKVKEYGGRKSSKEPKSWQYDPLALVDVLSFKEKPTSLSFEFLKRIAARDTIISAIINTRINQISRFAYPVYTRQDKIGFRVRYRDIKREMSETERKEAYRLERFLEHCGVPEFSNPLSDDFSSFLKKIVRDRLVYDAIAVEKIMNKKEELVSFVPVDASTIRIAIKKNGGGKLSPTDTGYIQYIQGKEVASFSYKELAYGVFYPRTDIKTYGYGFSEIEQLVTTITGHLWAEEYNRRYFCLNGYTSVITNLGKMAIKDLVGKEFQVWNGRNWVSATAFPTQFCPKVRTVLSNGLGIESSPEHRFLVATENEPVWKEQKELEVGDWVLINSRPYVGENNYKALKVGKEYYRTGSMRSQDSFIPSYSLVDREELYTLLGYLCASPTSGYLASFPPFLESIFYRIISFLKQFDLQYTVRVLDNDDKLLTITHKGFIDWLNDLGFKSDSLSIPEIVYFLPRELKKAFVRGFLLAKSDKITHVTSDDPSFLTSLSSLLDSVGISNYINENELICDAKEVNNIISDTDTYYSALPPFLAEKLINKIISSPHYDYLNNRSKNAILAWQKKEKEIKRQDIINMLKDIGEEVPWYLEYGFSPVAHVEKNALETELMYDLEVYDPQHIFIANGIAVHNSQGSLPKGILNIKGANLSKEKLDAFRRQWQAQVAGITGAWRLPIISSSEDIQFIPMHINNKDMEFSKWLDYIVNVICAIYCIDPSEINFPSRGGSGASSQEHPLFDSSYETKLRQSRDKGLYPLLDYIAHFINKHIIWVLNPDFEFTFEGLDRKIGLERLTTQEKEVSLYKTINEIRREEDLNPIDGGDIVLNATFVNYILQKEEKAFAERMKELDLKDKVLDLKSKLIDVSMKEQEFNNISGISLSNTEKESIDKFLEEVFNLDNDAIKEKEKEVDTLITDKEEQKKKKREEKRNKRRNKKIEKV